MLKVPLKAPLKVPLLERERTLRGRKEGTGHTHSVVTYTCPTFL